MATLSKHGATLVIIDRLRDRVAYKSDGTILRNDGSGWKLYKRVKPGYDIAQVARDAEQRYKQRLIERPVFAEYRKAVHDAACNGKRYMLVELLNMLANDPDGVWSEANDHLDLSIGVEECVELCRLHEAATAEQRELHVAPRSAEGSAAL